MNPGTEDSSSKKRGRPKVESPKVDVLGLPIEEKRPLNDTVDTVNSFLSKILSAKANTPNGEIPIVETTQEVFDYYMRGQKTPFFFFQDVKVFVAGTVEANEAREELTTNDVLFPTGG